MSAHARARRGALGLTLALAMASGACALTSKADTLEPRYFSPESPEGALRGAPPAAARRQGAPLAIRIGRIRGSADLRDKIVFRASAFEVGYYEERRWTERPEVYLRRALSRALFEERGLSQVVSGPGPTLDLDLLAFEEVRGPQPVARIRLTVVLHDEQEVRLEQTFTVEQPIASKGAATPEDIVRAMAEALRLSVAQLADRVVASLEAPPAAAPSGSALR